MRECENWAYNVDSTIAIGMLVKQMEQSEGRMIGTSVKWNMNNEGEGRGHTGVGRRLVATGKVDRGQSFALDAPPSTAAYKGRNREIMKGPKRQRVQS